MSTSSTPSFSSIPVPRPSASVVVINARNEILLVHRNPKARSFGGMTVFPGGNYDKKQDSSLAITAIRETFEESGLLLASADGSSSNSPPDDTQLDDARHSIHQQKLLFQHFLRSNNLKADSEALLPFTQWITPIGPPRRFHTQFYVAFLPAAPSSGFSSGAKQERIPKPDGGQEVISARFVHPSEALREFREGKITFMPPQFYILTTLSDILQGSRNTEEQRTKVESLSRGAFGRMVLNPRPRKPEDDDFAKGYSILVYEGDETRGGSKGRLHRAKLRMIDGVIREIVLQRNFDIFSEIESHPFQESSKL
ncbi:Putative nudix hydrolase 7 [Leucoagaricus sp. SymC.cos]|nr:Putative nudix hydrolase 7 [Leucoagaricus sp. SymC.cos]